MFSIKETKQKRFAGEREKKKSIAVIIVVVLSFGCGIGLAEEMPSELMETLIEHLELGTGN